MTEALPTKDDKLFCEGQDWQNNACLNFTHDGLYLYGYGYKEAADVLVGSVIDSGRGNDTLIHPIAFCYRQYLELSFKLIFRECCRLLDIQRKPLHGHSINKLWQQCLPLIEKIASDQCNDSLSEISRLVEEFSKIDPYATAFRYPEDNDGKSSLEGLKLINLRNLAEVISKMDIIVHGIISLVHEYQSAKNEMESDMY